jgi:hypothetical protein
MTTVLYARNVNRAFAKAVNIFRYASTDPKWVRQIAPRGTSTLEWTEPVMTVFDRPQERVLFNPYRDANPFLHFFGSLWMLEGRNDLEFLSNFTKAMRNFSNNGITLDGAYGYRWKSNFCGIDQVAEIIKLLGTDPASRRAVITMWDPVLDTNQESKDIPCNTSVYFKLRERGLDITVSCRSNDMVWGAYGTDSVDFSMLQEYVAGKLGVQVGRHYHLSDSFHVYLPPHPSGEVMARVLEHATPDSVFHDLYELGEVKPFNICAGQREWDEDLHRFFDIIDLGGEAMCQEKEMEKLKTLYFRQVVAPLWHAWCFRRQTEVAISHINWCQAQDWKMAAIAWLERRA